MEIRDSNGNVVLLMVGDKIYDSGGRWIFVRKGNYLCNAAGNWVYEIQDNRIYDTHGNFVYQINQSNPHKSTETRQTANHINKVEPRTKRAMQQQSRVAHTPETNKLRILFAIIPVIILLIGAGIFFMGGEDDAVLVNNNSNSSSVIRDSPMLSQNNDNEQQINTGNEAAIVYGRVLNVTSPYFELADGFIVPVVRLTAAPDDFIPIYTSDDFNRIRYNAAGNYILMADIDLSEIPDWEPIQSLQGVFEGNGFAIRNVTSSVFYEANEIRNVGVYADIIVEIVDDHSSVSVLAGLARYINNVYLHGTAHIVDKSETRISVGGLASFVETISNSFSTASVCVVSSNNGSIGSVSTNGVVVGGLVAAGNNIINSFNKGDITVRIEGESVRTYSRDGRARLISDYVPGNVYIGGIVGQIQGRGNLLHSFNSGDLAAVGYRFAVIGGVTGLIYTTDGNVEIGYSYNTGNIIASVSNEYGMGVLGGIAGEMFGRRENRTINLHNSFNSGNLELNFRESANLVSYVSPSSTAIFGIISGSPHITINFSYNVGSIVSAYDTVIGAISTSHAELNFLYFLDNVESATPENALFANVRQLSESEIREQTSFVGFDFENIWEMGGANHPFPVFRAIFEWQQED